MIGKPDTYGVEIWEPVEGDSSARKELRDHSERRQRRKVVRTLERPLELLFCRSYAEVVEDNIPLREVVFNRILDILLRLRYQF